ncbi:type III PLP-dependent enzyme [Rhizobium sp. 3T7]|uniref:type III PLP-dependent enzyme n=1 Tax=Rhizobium sp. 3T7 TaxID=2874922 RepID=UPI001CCDC0C3|nr:type III PLP-dependent enzyme [Rhizobium sp. 3T7]MBZ9792206.1 type III PLP-dependent enzyme [Rhizobium sp. 3T7]
MTAQTASAVLDEPDLSPRQLQARIQSSIPSLEKARHTGTPLASYPDVNTIIAELQPTEPVFCISPAKLRESAQSFQSFPGRALYAVKCNPHPFVLETLYRSGITDFDVASLDEIRLIDGMFGKAAGQFFNNPAKTRPAIRAASEHHGIRFYTADCMEEIEKIVDEAGSRDDLVIAVRLATRPADARYVLATKFGAQPNDAAEMLKAIHARGIRAGISFHVGSQCLAPGAFAAAVELAGKIATKAGVPLSVLNVGGGFPAPYPGDKIEAREHYFGNIVRAVRMIELPRGCIVLCEPGRSLVATAGTTIVQVVMRRGSNIFVNDGVFGTLQELGHPKEHRPTRLIRNGTRWAAPNVDFKIYGPTCDSNDVLGAPFNLPEDVREGDWIEIGMMGAYSLSMRTQFNGFYADTVVALGE